MFQRYRDMLKDIVDGDTRSWLYQLGLVDEAASLRNAPESNEEALEELLKVRVLLNTLKTREAFLESALTERITEKSATIGRMTVEKKRTTNRQTWDHQGLISEIFKAASNQKIPNSDGEPMDPLQGFRSAIEKCAAISYWRVNDLKDYGIDPWDYREVEWGREKIVVTEVATGDLVSSD